MERAAKRRAARAMKQLHLSISDRAVSRREIQQMRKALGARRLREKPEAYFGAMHGAGARQYRTKEGRFTPAHPGYRELGQVMKNPCEKRKERRGVLLAIGKVNKPGGAPGGTKGYKPRSKIKWDC